MVSESTPIWFLSGRRKGLLVGGWAGIRTTLIGEEKTNMGTDIEETTDDNINWMEFNVVDDIWFWAWNLGLEHG